jgi:hypothetical protein
MLTTSREKALLAALDRIAKTQHTLAGVRLQALSHRIGVMIFTVLFGCGVLVCSVLAVIDLSVGLKAGQPQQALPVLVVLGVKLLVFLVVLRIVAVVQGRKHRQQIAALQDDIANRVRQLLADFPEAGEGYQPTFE